MKKPKFLWRFVATIVLVFIYWIGAGVYQKKHQYDPVAASMQQIDGVMTTPKTDPKLAFMKFGFWSLNLLIWGTGGLYYLRSRKYQ